MNLAKPVQDGRPDKSEFPGAQVRCITHRPRSLGRFTGGVLTSNGDRRGARLRVKSHPIDGDDGSFPRGQRRGTHLGHLCVRTERQIIQSKLQAIYAEFPEIDRRKNQCALNLRLTRKRIQLHDGDMIHG